ncbi:MAG TPA: tRNA lysidine(34) synthetase TilS [Anaerolineae bacterium]|nr:tRNA lysidine(34) synthetase TilS [Anaerolineae bacterium]
MDLARIKKELETRCNLKQNSKVLVGVSGGPDSLCLLHILNKLGFPLVVAHLNHKIRHSADAEADFVAKMADKYDLPFVLMEKDIKSLAKERRASLEEVAREERYWFLFTTAEEHQALAVAVGHTADDQVETVLLHILRGSGLRGLTGMQIKSITKYHDMIALIRPLIGIWRVQIEAYCEQNNLHPCFDESNWDNSYSRNRVRNELIPHLTDFNPRIKDRLLSLADILRGDFWVLEKFAEKAYKKCMIEEGIEYLLFSLEGIKKEEIGIQRLILRKALEKLLQDLREVDFQKVEMLRNFIFNPNSSRHMELKKGVNIYLRNDSLVITLKKYPPLEPNWPQVKLIEQLQLKHPGLIKLPNGWLIDIKTVSVPKVIKSKKKPGEIFCVHIDVDKLSQSLYLRNCKPGDRFNPLGMGDRSKKVSDFWIDKKIPRWARSHWPIVFSENRIIWIPGFQPAHFCRIKGDTQKALRIEVKKAVA